MKFVVCMMTAMISTIGTVMARDQVKIAGSSTVLPYANIVAEEYSKTFFKFKTPIIESGGSSAGLKLFCQGLGPNTIDVANSSRKIRDQEIKACARNGVNNIIEVSFGYDGIVFVSGVKGPTWVIEPRDVYLALAAKIPFKKKMIDNPNKTWKDVNVRFPAWRITAYIPGEKHGTREVFESKLLRVGCRDSGAGDLMKLTGMGKEAIEKECISVRKDGGTVDIDGDYNEILGRLKSNNTGIGIISLSFYENNTDKLKVASVNGILPSLETISSGAYIISRPLYFYVKKDHIGVIPGLKEYLEFFTSSKMIGSEGPLAEYGLVPMPAAEHKALLDKVNKQKTL
ncbi:MAG: Phosphate-binding protein PstS [Hyphomicrobiaceae bacterium hypho_1]